MTEEGGESTVLIVWSVADKRDTQTPRNCERNIKRQWYKDTDTAAPCGAYRNRALWAVAALVRCRAV